MRRSYSAALAAAGLATAAALLPAADPAQAATTTLCGMQTETVSGGSYTVQSNEFGSSATECVSADGQADFTVSSSSVNVPTNGMPAGYPSIYSGCHWGDCTETGLGKNPVKVSSLTYSTAETTWEFTGPSSSGGAWDASYDVWINKTPDASAPNGVELMVRLRHSDSILPVGSKVVSNVSIDGTTYDIWWNPPSGSSIGTVTYQMVNQENAARNFSLQPLALNAVARGYMSSSWYLADIEAGFEIWQGGVGLRTDDFSVNG
jgi:cellulose 1,4-beta-cellobiosidase